MKFSVELPKEETPVLVSLYAVIVLLQTSQMT